jgi:hypothetical protein
MSFNKKRIALLIQRSPSVERNCSTKNVSS